MLFLNSISETFLVPGAHLHIQVCHYFVFLLILLLLHPTTIRMHLSSLGQ
uniref:Uncharacterized protein n=1 Tax=Anguilla anguilla TaxID=7936 RepID=A0A0E9U4Y5_ANGAN